MDTTLFFPLATIIAGGEPASREILRLLLEREQGVKIIAECGEVKHASQLVAAHSPDLLLVDVEMEGGTGFDVLGKLPADRPPAVILTAAHDSYALQAFDTCALDYILKPFNRERVHRAIGRAKREIIRSRPSLLREAYFRQMSTAKRVLTEDRLIVKSDKRVIFIPADEVEWIEAERNYVRIHVVGKVAYPFRETIGRMANRLDLYQFIRIHRSIIVNVSRIKELHPCNNGEFIVLLRTGKELPCSRFYRHALEALWKEADPEPIAQDHGRALIDARW